MGIEGKYLNIIKGIHHKSSQHDCQWWKAESLHAKCNTRQGCTLSPLLFSIVLEILVTEIRQEKEINCIQIEREAVKPSLYADDLIIYVENPKVPTKKLLELTNEFRSCKIQD